MSISTTYESISTAYESISTAYETMNVEGGHHVKVWTRGVPVEDEAQFAAGCGRSKSWAQFPGRRKTVTVVLPPPISGATKLYTPTMPETTATFCTPCAL